MRTSRRVKHSDKRTQIRTQKKRQQTQTQAQAQAQAQAQTETHRHTHTDTHTHTHTHTPGHANPFRALSDIRPHAARRSAAAASVAPGPTSRSRPETRNCSRVIGRYLGPSSARRPARAEIPSRRVRRRAVGARAGNSELAAPPPSLGSIVRALLGRCGHPSLRVGAPAATRGAPPGRRVGGILRLNRRIRRRRLAALTVVR